MNALKISTTALFCCALQANAGVPQSLTMVPSDADVIVAMPDLGEFLSDVDTVNAIMGDFGNFDLVMATSMMRGMPGMNLNGSAAIILDINEQQPNQTPGMMALLPVTDFDTMSQGRDPVNGIVEMNLGGMPLFVRDLGSGYAAVGVDVMMLNAFEAADHSDADVQAMLGGTGSSMIDSSDLFVMLNLDAVRPMIEQSLSDLEAQAEMVELMAGPDAAQAMDSMLNMYATAVEDGQSVMHAMTFDADAGLAADFAIQFKDGSEAADMLQNEGRASQFMSRVPGVDFIYAAAFDFSGEGLKEMMSGYIDMMDQMDTNGMMGAFNPKAMMELFSGGAMVMGAPKNLMGGGILTNMMMYVETEDADAYIDEMRDLYKSMSGLEQQGVSMLASLSDEAIDVDGIRAYEHAMLISMPNQGAAFGAPSPDMIMQMMYGPNKGPAGYVASTDSGVVLTMSQDADMLSKAVSATNGVGTLRANKGIAAAAGMLPENRVMEIYLGVESIMNTVGPMAMMFGAIPEFEPVNNLTPIAMGATADNGAFMLRTVMPIETMKATIKMIPADMVNGAANDAWDDDDNDDDGAMSF